MVSAYWGIPVLQEDVARWLGTSDIGTPSSRIQRLTLHGYSITYAEGSATILAEWLQQGVPPILFVQTDDLPYWEINTAHAVVIAGSDSEQAILIDPAKDAPYFAVSIGDLLLGWSHFDYTFAAVKPS